MPPKSTPKRRASKKEGALSLFVELSSVLIGQPADPATARRHFATLQGASKDHPLGPVFQRFRAVKAAGGDIVQGVKDRLVNDAALGPLVKTVMSLWFTGQQAGQGAPVFASQDDYFQALMWSCVGAHPPALSDGYFGHWRYPPDTGR
jgi:hypothetical protein